MHITTLKMVDAEVATLRTLDPVRLGVVSTTAGRFRVLAIRNEPRNRNYFDNYEYHVAEVEPVAETVLTAEPPPRPLVVREVAPIPRRNRPRIPGFMAFKRR